MPQPAVFPFSPASFSLNLGGSVFHFIRPSSMEAVLGAIPEESEIHDRHHPFWAECWPSSEILVSFLLSRPLPNDWKVCDLGCGLGIAAGALAARRHTVIATDISWCGCRFTAHNMDLNGGVPRVCCADWRSLPFRRCFDLLIASDILYEERFIGPVIEAVERLLGENGKAWIADPCRRFWAPFRAALDLHSGLVHRIIERAMTCGGKTAVEIVEVSRKRPDTEIPLL